MNNNEIYQLSAEIFKTCFFYYNKTKDYAEKMYNYFKNYHQYTKDYHMNLKNKLHPNFIDEKEKNNINENSDKIINDSENTFKLYKNFSKIIRNNYDEKIKNMDKFLDDLGNSINNLKNKIDEKKKKIKQIDKEILDNKKDFLNKCSNYEDIKKKLLDNLFKTEKNLVELLMKRKEEKNEENELEKNIKNKVNESLKMHQNYETELTNNKFVNDFKMQVNDHVNIIKKIIISLIDEIKNIINISITEKDINSSKFEIDIDFDEIQKKIDEKTSLILDDQCEIKLPLYNIKILEDKNYFKNYKPSITESKRLFILKKKIFKKVNNDELTDEDIFNIVTFMYKFSCVDKQKYNLKVESNNILRDNKNDNEIDSLMQLINDDENKNENILTFLIILNNFRSSGKFELSKYTFDILSKMLNTICNNFAIFLEKENKIIENNLEHIELILIISQTFYFLEKPSKIYLSRDLINNNLFHMGKLWEIYIKFSIEKDINRVTGFKCLDDKDKNEKIDTIIISQLASIISYMKEFNLEIKNINKIIWPILEENYNKISQETKENIKNIINN